MKSTKRTIYLAKQFETAVRMALEDVLRPLGFTAAQYTMLSIIAARPGEYSSADIARRLLITPQSANETMKALEERGLISRIHDPANPNILRTHLAGRGEAILKDLDSKFTKLENSLLAPLSEREHEAFHEFLSRLVESGRP